MTATPQRIRAGVLPVEGWTPSSDTTAVFRYVDISSVDRETKSVAGAIKLPVAEAPSRARQLLRADDVLVSTVRPNLNAVAMVPPELDGAVGSTGFTVLRANLKRLLPRYLFHWVRTPMFVADMVKKATGASYPAIGDRIVLDSCMPMPAVDEQRRIADILDKADAIRRKRKEAIALTEALLRSAFLEMFGDPVTNPKGWPTITLAEIADVNRGKFTPRPRNDPRFYGGEYPFIQTGDLTGATGYLLRWRQTLNRQGTLVSRGFPKGAIAITIAANIGDTAIVDFDFWCPDSVVVIEPRAVPSEFLEFLMRFLQPRLEAMAPETAQKNINLEVLRPLCIILPPKSAQERFAGFYKQAYITKQRQAQAVAESENLFSSLLDRAFRGELTAPTSKSASRTPKQLSLLE